MKTVTRLLFMTVVLLTGLSREASACSCVLMPDSCSRIDGSTTLFEATVDRIETRMRPGPDVAFPLQDTVVHLRDVRGLVGEPATVVFTGRGHGDCGYAFEVGERYLIDGARREQHGDVWTGTCGRTRPIAQAAGLRDYLQNRASSPETAHLFGSVTAAPPHRRSTATPRPRPQPIAHARVFLMGPVRTSTTTGPDGQFSVGGLLPGDYTVSVQLSSPRSELEAIESRTVSLERPGACAEVGFHAPYATRVQGTVVDVNGKPMAGAFVALLPSPRVFVDAGGAGVNTGPDGRYSFSDLAPGGYVVGLSLMGGPGAGSPFAVAYGRDRGGEAELTVPEGAAVIEVQPITAERLEPFRMVGTVQSLDGVPQSGLTVAAHVLGERGVVGGVVPAETAADGTFTLRHMYRGARYRITVRHGARIVHRAEIVADDVPLTIQLTLPKH